MPHTVPKSATKGQIRRLYFLLYKKGLDRYDVKEAVENICRYLKVWTIGDINTEQIEKAYKLVNYINEYGELDVDKMGSDDYS